MKLQLAIGLRHGEAQEFLFKVSEDAIVSLLVQNAKFSPADAKSAVQAIRDGLMEKARRG